MVVADHTYYVAEWVSFSLSVISFACTVATLIVIYQMKKRSGYVILISYMTFFQLLYDINYMLRPVPSYASCLIWNFFDVWGGLGNAFFSNVISWTIIYVVYKVKSYNIIANLPYFFFVCGIIPFAFALLVFVVMEPQNFDDDDAPFQYCVFSHTPLSESVENFYYWGRLFAIIFNFASFIYVSYRIRKIAAMATQMKRGSLIDVGATTRQTTVHQYISEQQVDAIFVLANRMIYYPIAQALGRVGSAWNEFLDHRYETTASLFTSSITAPLSGILYFVIFLIMQPHARTILYNFLTGKFNGQTLSVSAVHLHNINNVMSNPSEYDAKRFVFRDSLSQVEEGELEDIINDKQFNTIPFQFTTNPVQESGARNNRLQSNTGSIAWFQDRMTAEREMENDDDDQTEATRDTHGESIISAGSKSFVSRSTEARSMYSLDSRSTLTAVSDAKSAMIEMKSRGVTSNTESASITSSDA